jgi:hypothetical protein
MRLTYLQKYEEVRAVRTESGTAGLRVGVLVSTCEQNFQKNQKFEISYFSKNQKYESVPTIRLGKTVFVHKSCVKLTSLIFIQHPVYYYVLSN